MPGDLRGPGLRAGAGRSCRRFRGSLSAGGSRGLYRPSTDNPDYTAIINDRQLARLNGYISDATSKAGALLIPLFDKARGAA